MEKSAGYANELDASALHVLIIRGSLRCGVESFDRHLVPQRGLDLLLYSSKKLISERQD